MLVALLVILIVLWFLGYIHIPNFFIPNIALFTLNGHIISLWDVLIFLVITALIGILPSPIRQIAFVVYILWVLSTLGFLAIPGLASILVIAIIVGAVISIFGVS